MTFGRVVAMKGQPHRVPGKPRRYYDLVVSIIDQRDGGASNLVLVFDEDQTALLVEDLQALGLARPAVRQATESQESQE